MYLHIQRCQTLRITRSHYGNLQKFSVFYELRKTRIFLRKLKKKIVIRNVAKKVLNKRMISDGVEFLSLIFFTVTATICSVFHDGKSMDQGCHATWKTGKSQEI